MAKKVFDILPPPKREYHHHRESPSKKEKKKSFKAFWGLIFGLFLIGVIYLFVKNSDMLGPNAPDTPSNPPKSSGFELFDESGQGTLTQTPVKIQVVNASSGTTTYQDIANLLVSQGFSIQKASESSTPSAQTIIYYKSSALTSAQKAQSLLSAKFKPILQEKNDLNKNIDLSITIGKSGN